MSEQIEELSERIADLDARQDKDDRRTQINTIIFRIGAPLIGVAVTIAVAASGWALSKGEQTALNTNQAMVNEQRIARNEAQIQQSDDRVRALERESSQTRAVVDSMRRTLDEQNRTLQTVLQEMRERRR